MATPRVWLITGASTGFGRSLTELVLRRGDIAVATLRKPEMLADLAASHSKDKLLVHKLDVTNQADVEQAFARTKEMFGRLDVVFNNAGVSMLGDAESTPFDKARPLFEVNFWGAVNVTRAAVKFFREVNEPGRGGVLLQNSSIAGLTGSPGLGMYSASKHALQGYSASLANEVLPEWNIKICVISAGLFRTSVFDNSTILPVNPDYNKEGTPLGEMWKVIGSGEPFDLGADPAKFAQAIYGLVEGGRLPLRFPIGQDAVAVAKVEMEALGKDIAESEPWSMNLQYDKEETIAK